MAEGGWNVNPRYAFSSAPAEPVSRRGGRRVWRLHRLPARCAGGSRLPGTAGRGPACPVVWEAAGEKSPHRPDYAFLDVPQFKQLGRCIQISSLHALHCQRIFSFRTNCLIPTSSICLRFSIMLMPYFSRYLLSRFFSRKHGKEAQLLLQYFPLRSSQKRKVHFLLHFVLGVRQPSHLFLSRTYPMQRRQFIPHGAMSDILACVVIRYLSSRPPRVFNIANGIRPPPFDQLKSCRSHGLDNSKHSDRTTPNRNTRQPQR